MVIPCGFIPFSVFHNESGIKKTDGHGCTWVWSYSFSPLSDLLMFSVFFCLFPSVRDSNVDPEIALVHLGHGVLEVSVGVCVCVRVSLGFVSMNALLILSAKNCFDQLCFRSHPSSFIPPLLLSLLSR